MAIISDEIKKELDDYIKELAIELKKLESILIWFLCLWRAN